MLSDMRQRLVIGGSWALAGQAFILVIGLPASYLLARLLNPSEMGAYLLALSIASFGMTIGGFGLNQVVVRLVAESLGKGELARARGAIRTVFRVGLPAAAITGGLYLIFGVRLIEKFFHKPHLFAANWAVACWMVALSVQSLLSETLRSFGDIRNATIFGGTLTSGLSLVGITFLSLGHFDGNVSTVVVIAVGAVMVSCTLGGLSLRRRLATRLPAAAIPAEDVKGGYIVRVAVPLLFATLFQVGFAQADLWVVGASRPADEVALYGVALRLVALIGVPQVVLVAVLLPIVAELWGQQKIEELESVLRTTATAVSLPVILAIGVFGIAGGTVLSVIYGDYYRRAAPVLFLLSLSHLGVIWFGSCGLVLVMIGRQKLILLISAVVGTVTVLVELLVVRHTGMLGVATVSASGTILMYLISWLAARSTAGVWTHFSLRSARALLRQAVSLGNRHGS